MKNDKMKLQYRVNEKIHVREVRVVSDEGSEVMPTRKALDLARQQGVDLVEISPNASRLFVVSSTIPSSSISRSVARRN